MPSHKGRDGRGLTRRRAMRLFGLASALPLLHPGLTPYSVKGNSRRASWHPRFLSPEDIETVASLCDCIVFGAHPPVPCDTPVHEYIDFALSEAEPAVQKGFNEGLAWLDRYAAHSRQAKFTSLPRDEQYQLLSEISDTSRSHEPTGYAFLTHIKQLTIEGYYSSDRQSFV